MAKDINKNISVLLCTYNPYIKFFIKQLDSIINQSMKVNCIFIYDDSCDDKLKRFLDVEYEHEIDSGFINYRCGPKSGVTANFLSGIMNENFDWLFLCDQDDIWDYKKVEIYSNSFIESNEPILYFSDSILIDESDNIIGKSFFKFQKLSHTVLGDDSILVRNCVQGATICINSRVKDFLSICDITSPNIMIHDWWLAIVVKYYGSVKMIPGQYLLYRQHENNIIGAVSSSDSKFFKLFHPIIFFKNIINISKQSIYFFKVYMNKNCYNSFCFDGFGFFKGKLINLYFFILMKIFKGESDKAS
ncbi:glycosyltransferase [Vibrio viridaestus]|uniref:Glycosyltransferase n=1 Tax=Vibrio viridaestus TaxID=2487322 RepID=A0A3N9TCF1_9VIBR|nr:glycosyltransferase [Vibrio viridaestus]RQW61710.1 glycosyltransferase [Vibrio viridaestus]